MRIRLIVLESFPSLFRIHNIPTIQAVSLSRGRPFTVSFKILRHLNPLKLLTHLLHLLLELLQRLQPVPVTIQFMWSLCWRKLRFPGWFLVVSVICKSMRTVVLRVGGRYPQRGAMVNGVIAVGVPVVFARPRGAGTRRGAKDYLASVATPW